MSAECAHGGELEMKFDGGRCAMLCPYCRTVLGYYRHAAAVTPDPSPTNAFEDAEVAREEANDERDALLRIIIAVDDESDDPPYAVYQRRLADAILAAGYTCNPENRLYPTGYKPDTSEQETT